MRADRRQKVLICVHVSASKDRQLCFVLTTSGRAGRYVHVLLNANRQFVNFGNSLDVSGKDKQRDALLLHPCWKAGDKGGKTALM